MCKFSSSELFWVILKNQRKITIFLWQFFNNFSYNCFIFIWVIVYIEYVMMYNILYNSFCFSWDDNPWAPMLWLLHILLPRLYTEDSRNLHPLLPEIVLCVYIITTLSVFLIIFGLALEKFFAYGRDYYN